jgi:hypothetical protein
MIDCDARSRYGRVRLTQSVVDNFGLDSSNSALAATFPKRLGFPVKDNRGISFAKEENIPYNEKCIKERHGLEYPGLTSSLRD